MNYSGVDWQRYYLKIFDDPMQTVFAFRVEDAYKRSRFCASIKQYITRNGMDDMYKVNIERGKDLVVVRKMSA